VAVAVGDLAEVLETAAEVQVRAEVGPVGVASTPVVWGVVIMVCYWTYRGVLSKDRFLGVFCMDSL